MSDSIKDRLPGVGHFESIGDFCDVTSADQIVAESEDTGYVSQVLVRATC